jgi:hypothetical protein
MWGLQRDRRLMRNVVVARISSIRAIPFSIHPHYNDNAVRTLTIGVDGYVVNVLEDRKNIAR